MLLAVITALGVALTMVAAVGAATRPTRLQPLLVPVRTRPRRVTRLD